MRAQTLFNTHYSRVNQTELQQADKPQNLPQIDVDNFDPEKMAVALTDYGTYELVGGSIDHLRELANKAMMAVKTILRLYDKTSTAKKLKEVAAANFNGFQDVRAETEARVRQGTEPAVRNQIAFHFKPYEKVSKIPEGIAAEVAAIFAEYYKAAEAVLKKHYQDIAKHFIADEYVSDLSFNEAEEKTVLMMRRYFAPNFKQMADDDEGRKEQVQKEPLPSDTSTTGIPSHSDHGLLTLVTSDEPGLEVFVVEQWLSANYDPSKLNFFINFGDWALFQILASMKKYPEKYQKNNFKEGLHRVPHINKERHSLILALNPHKNEMRPTPLGGEVTYQTFLQGKKSDFRDTSRDDSANYLVKQINALTPEKRTPVPQGMPELYVAESFDYGQESWKFVKGDGKPLCDVTAAKELPPEAYKGTSYAYTSENAAIECEKLATQGKDVRLYKINLRYADDIYVANEDAGTGLQENDARVAIAKTLIPLAEYQGNYEKPVYLIQRGLRGGYEADDITAEYRKLLEKVEMSQQQIHSYK